MSAKVASLLIDVAADIASLRKDFDQAGKTVQGFGATVTAIGKGIASAFSIHEVIAFGERIQADIDAMADLAENLKMPVEEFQTLQNAALLAGQSVEATGNAIAKFNVFAGKASEGNKEVIETLEALGVKFNNLDGSAKSQTQRLQEIAAAIIKIEDPAKRAAAEVAIFGKTGQSVSAILAQWARPLDEVNKELQAMGLVHSPAVIKSMAEMADKMDIASKQIDVLFAPIYAMAKSNAMAVVSGGFQLIANAINGIQQGKVEDLGRLLAAMAQIGTGNLLGAFATITGGPSATQQLLTDLRAASDEVTKLNDGLANQVQMWGENSIATQQYRNRLNEAQQKLDVLSAEAARRGLLPTIPAVTATSTGTNTPIKGAGDKFAETMARIQRETLGVNEAIANFEKLSKAGFATENIERYSKLYADIAAKQSQMMKDLTPDQAKQIEPMIVALEMAKFRYDDLKRSQQEADNISRTYGDGQKELLETTQRLYELRVKQLITEEEYLAAIEAANEKAEEQQAIYDKQKDGLEALGAGFEYAMSKMEKSTSMFEIGSQLFTGSVSLMSNAITEFVEKGSIDFNRLALSFAKMLADMAVQLAMYAALKAILSAFAGGVSAASPSSTMSQYNTLSDAWRVPGFPSGGGQAAGGPVLPGYGYTVGEQGIERFVPSVPGRIEPNGGGQGDIVINNNAPGVEVQATRRDDGEVAIIIERTRRALSRDVQRGGNLFASAMERTYGVARGGSRA